MDVGPAAYEVCYDVTIGEEASPPPASVTNVAKPWVAEAWGQQNQLSERRKSTCTG